MRRSIPTMEDIARHAGVSRTTVSFVLNDVPVPLQPKTRARVLAAARALGYYPNSIARALSMGRSGVFALLVPNLSDAYFSELAEMTWLAAAGVGYRLAVSPIHQDVAPVADLLALIAQRVDGILLNAVEYPSNPAAVHLPELDRFPLPIVLSGARTPQPPPQPAVQFDLEASGYVAGRHLLALGRRRVLFVGLTDARLTGLRRALHEAGQTVHVIACTGPEQVHAEMIMACLAGPSPFDAVVASNDNIALRMLSIVQASERRVPDDVAVLGMGNVTLCRMLYPSLTSVSLRRRELVNTATNMLTSLARGEAVEPALVMLQPELVVRASTAGHAAALDDPPDDGSGCPSGAAIGDRPEP